MKTLNIKAASWKSAAFSLGASVLCTVVAAQTGLNQGRWATEYEEMLIEEGYIFFPPLRTRKNSPQSAPAVTQIPNNTQAKTSVNATKEPAQTTPAAPLLLTKQDTKHTAFVDINSIEPRPSNPDENKSVIADPKPTRQAIKEKSLLILTFK